jgi:hypothetical protein
VGRGRGGVEAAAGGGPACAAAGVCVSEVCVWPARLSAGAGGGRDFVECQIRALVKASTALPIANLEALCKARISFQNSSIQNLFKHICLNIIQHFITKLMFQTNISCFNEKIYYFNHF